MMIKVKFIGTGGAFDVDYFNSAALVSIAGKRILVDCGNRIYSRLIEKDAIHGIDYVLITHMHDDHIGSLSSLILHYFHFLPAQAPLKLVYTDEYQKDELTGYLTYSLLHPEQKVQLVSINDLPFVTCIDTFGLHVRQLATRGFLFRSGDEAVAYSGDVGDADVIFKSLIAENLEGAIVFHELIFQKGISAHVYYKDLYKYRDKFRIYGYHCDASANPADNLIPLVFNTHEFML